jgi:hypothetical protein
MGILIDEAKHGTVSASVFAPAAYQPQRLSDLFGRHTLSHQAFMAALARLVLRALYRGGTACALVLAGRLHADREALCQANCLRRVVSSHQAGGGARPKAQRAVLRPTFRILTP